ncbi:MAG: DUF2336 domain-containing protein [Hyphomicrobiaceae bacterium]|nr:DUF2336 domain-containing protein [Hyphomicrobiaceae bacterium]
MMHAVETELVNFKRLADDKSIEQRNDLIGHVADLYLLTVERCPSELVATYDDVLIRLADLVETATLKVVSEKIATHDKAPKGFLRRLAVDDIEVARPVIRNAVDLAVDDLISIARLGSKPHLLELADRKALPVEVTDIVVEEGDVEVHHRVCANESAQFSERGFRTLLDSSLTDEVLQERLSTRRDLPAAIVTALVEEASEAVRRKLKSRGFEPAERSLGEAKAIVAERLSADPWLQRYDFDSAARLVGLRARAERLTEPMILDYLRGGQFAEGVAALAIMAEIPMEAVRHWSMRSDPKPFLYVCRALDFGKATVAALLEAGPWLRKLDRQGRSDALQAYELLDPALSRRIIEQLSGSGA